MEIVTAEIENLIQNKIKFAEKKFGEEFKNLLLEIVSLEKMVMLALAPKEAPSKPDNLIALSEWNNFHSYPTVQAMRKLHFERYKNGFEDFNVTRKKNGRVIVNENNFFKWYNAQQNNK